LGWPAKLPKGLLNVVTGRGDVVGAELVRNPNVDKISFTGSVAVGERIMRDGAATPKRAFEELNSLGFETGRVLEAASPETLGRISAVLRDAGA
jgi:delta 1-pyrroline-5-carboxylate dehydrogenase